MSRWVDDTFSLKFSECFRNDPKMSALLRHRMPENDSNEWFWTKLTASSKAVDFLRSTWCRPAVLEVTSLKFDNCWQCVASWQMQKASRIISVFLCHLWSLVPLQWCKWCITVSFIVRSANRCSSAATSWSWVTPRGPPTIPCIWRWNLKKWRGFCPVPWLFVPHRNTFSSR